MSLGIVFKGPEGIVLAADSRATIMAVRTLPQPITIPAPNPIVVQALLQPASYDNATKLLKVDGQQYVAAVTYGAAAIGQTSPRTAHGFLAEFEAKLNEEHVERLSVEQFANKLSEFFAAQWVAGNMPAHPQQQEQMVFLVGGFDLDAAYGRVFTFEIPLSPQPSEQLVDDFGLSWGGQREFADRLIHGYDPSLIELMKEEFDPTPEDLRDLNEKVLKKLAVQIPYQFLPLQDCVDLSLFLIRTTISLQQWQAGIRGVGGAIDVATITRKVGFKSIQEKQIRGER